MVNSLVCSFITVLVDTLNVERNPIQDNPKVVSLQTNLLSLNPVCSQWENMISQENRKMGWDWQNLNSEPVALKIIKYIETHIQNIAFIFCK